MKVRAALGLSPTQSLVAIGIWLGLSETQIAVWLGKKRPTIHSHIRTIYQKLEALGLQHGQAAIVRAVERAVKGADPAAEQDQAANPKAPSDG